MKRLSFVLIIIASFILLCQCYNKKYSATDNSENVLSFVGGKNDKINEEHQLQEKKAWEEANKYRTAITDTTFLQTKEEMSDAAIAPSTGKGWNKDYAFNQVVYLKALERAKRYLSVKDNRLIFNLKSGTEIRISEDLFQYIVSVFAGWNLGIKEGKYKITTIEEGGYDILPVVKTE